MKVHSDATRGKAVAALLSHATIADAAQAAGVGQRTLRRWLDEDEAFRAELHAARRAHLDHVTTALQAAATKAVETLRSVMDDPDAPHSARVSASKTVLDAAYRALELQDLAERLARLEEAQDGLRLPR